MTAERISTKYRVSCPGVCGVFFIGILSTRSTNGSSKVCCVPSPVWQVSPSSPVLILLTRTRKDEIAFALALRLSSLLAGEPRSNGEAGRGAAGHLRWSHLSEQTRSRPRRSVRRRILWSLASYSWPCSCGSGSRPRLRSLTPSEVAPSRPAILIVGRRSPSCRGTLETGGAAVLRGRSC